MGVSHQGQDMILEFLAAMRAAAQEAYGRHAYGVSDELFRWADTAERAFTAGPMMWGVMDTAPRDGRLLVIYEADREGGITVARWVDGAWLDRDEFQCEPTHWMPLPDPPKAAGVPREAPK